MFGVRGSGVSGSGIHVQGLGYKLEDGCVPDLQSEHQGLGFRYRV